MTTEVDNIPITKARDLLKSVDLNQTEKDLIDGLLIDYGYLGAIQYLKPKNVIHSGRDQVLANRHRAILESFSSNRPTATPTRIKWSAYIPRPNGTPIRIICANEADIKECQNFQDPDAYIGKEEIITSNDQLDPNHVQETYSSNLQLIQQMKDLIDSLWLKAIRIDDEYSVKIRIPEKQFNELRTKVGSIDQ